LKSLFVAMAIVASGLLIAKWWGVIRLAVIAIFAAPVLFVGRGRSRDLRLLQSACVYLGLSIVTLPFLDAVWLGELPVLAIGQVPKIDLAHWLRGFIIRHVMWPLGWSRGSASPDLIAASPYALALAYVLPIGMLLAAVAWRTRMPKPHRYWACALVILAAIDYWMIRTFASGPGLTIY
jgi:hypothetical protein